MPNYLIKPEATHLADPEDLTNAVLALDVSDPGSITGLPNDVTLVAQEIRLSPVSVAFTPTAATPFTLTSTGDDEVELTGIGTFAISVTQPSTYVGNYTLETAGLSNGPVNFALPRIAGDGSPAVGEALSSTPGLWAYDTPGAVPTIARQWTRNGADIPGATGETYTLAATDAGTDVALRETATQTGTGSRDATSTVLSIPAGSGTSADLTFLDSAVLPFSTNDALTFTNLNIGTPSPDRRIIAAVTMFHPQPPCDKLYHWRCCGHAGSGL